MFVFELGAKLIKALRSAASPGQIAGGFILGMIIGLTPFWSLHNLLVVLLIAVINVNISMAIFSVLLFSGFAYLLDPLFHDLGYFILVDMKSLHGFFTSMYNIPVVALSNFNNTVLMGSLAVSIVMLIPMYFLIRRSVILYREKVDARIQKWKIVQVIKGSKAYRLYERIKYWGE